MATRVDSVSLYRMKKLLMELSAKTGRGTELVSLYVPPGKALHEVMNALRDEYGTAANIKSDTTRNHVQDALTKTMQRLKMYKQAPEAGLVIFAGAIPTESGPGNEVVEVYEIIPPKPIQTYLYRCDDHFHLDPLRELLKEEKVIGILSLDTTEAGLGIVSGSKFEVVDVASSGVSGKHRAGGQSARRFERMREMELTEYFNRVARHAAKIFLEEHRIEGLILSGPGPTKDDFFKGRYLDYRIQDAIIATLDTSYAGSEGVRETLEKSEKILQDIRVMEERRLVQRFLREVSAANGLVTYGANDVVASLQRGNVENVLVSEAANLHRVVVTCKNCGASREKIIPRDMLVIEKQKLIASACSNCSSTEFELSEWDIVEYLNDLVLSSGAKVEVISSKTEEGAMLKSFGGVAAILRYR